MSDLLHLPWYALIALLAKASLVLASGLLLASMRQAGPALRHTIVLASICGALALLPLSIAMPRWSAAVLPAPSAVADRSVSPAATFAGRGQPPAIVPDTRSAPPVGAVASAAGSESPAGRDVAERTQFPTPAVLIAIWLIGAFASLARLLVERLGLRAVAARAWAAHDVPWAGLLEEEKRLAGVSGPVRLLVSPSANTPMTWGTRVPVVLLPEDALQWSTEHRRIVLRHELGHVARGDSLGHSLAAFACAVYWFHPLALMAARRLRSECEHACDDRVVALGTEPRVYASHLLDVARAAREIGSRGLLSLAMARPSHLEGRLRALLDGARPRGAPTRAARVVAISLLTALAMAASAFHPVRRATSTRASDPAAREPGDTVRPAASAAPMATPATPPVPANVGRLAALAAATDTLAAPVRAPADTSAVERNVDVRNLDDENVDILLRADLSLPGSAPVQIVLGRDENLVLVNDTIVHPLDLRAAIELVKQVRATYGQDIPGGALRIAAPPHRASTMRPSDAEPYAVLLRGLGNAPMEVINGRPAARHQRFGEHPVVEVAVSDTTLARLLQPRR